MPKTTTIPIDNWNMGGLSDSKWSGIKNSFYKLIGLDIHSQPGTLKVAQKLTKFSSTTVTEFCKERVASSNGAQYWGSSTSGKIWEITSGGTVRLVDTIAPTTGSAAILGMAEYQGWIYIATQNWLHRIKVDEADDNDWATDLVENWQPLNLDQAELNSTGNTYTNTTGVNEGATHKLAFTPVYSPIESIALNVNAVGTGNWTVKIHDSSDNEVATATIANGSMATGWVYFTFTSVFYPTLGNAYHAHVYSSVADGSTKTTTSSDFSTANAKINRQTDSSYHPMLPHPGTLVLYIGNGNLVAQVDAGTFTDAALDITNPYRIKSLGDFGTDLLIGTYTSDSVTQAQVFRWNTWSTSFTSSDLVPEVSINAFIPADNFILVQAGNQGNLYVYNGQQLELFNRIPGSYSPTAYGEVYPSSVINLNGQILFGFSNGSGNPAEQGVYRFARSTRNHPWVLDMPYPISERSSGALVTSGIEIGGILSVGNDLYVAWKNGSSYGIDKLDYTAKNELAYFETRVMFLDRIDKDNYAKVVAGYITLPASTAITIELDKDYNGTYVGTDEETDSQRNIVTGPISDDVNTLQVKVSFTVSSNDAPQLDSAYVVL